MNSKRLLAALSLVSCMALATAAEASNAPTSQFGFKGWPYRQNTSCGSIQSSRPTQDSCGATPRPSAVPTVKPTAAPTAAPTAQPTPTATAKPTVMPEVQPTNESSCPVIKPTATAAATPKPIVTARPTATKAPVATVLPTAAPSTPSTGDDYTTVGVSAQEENAVRLLNQDRATNGLPALTADPALCRLARMKSQDMNANHYFAHTSPTLGSAADMLRANGYAFTSVGENIAHHATVEKSQAAFMSSDGHRRNILGSQWTKVGVGVCYDSNGYVYVTQLFVR